MDRSRDATGHCCRHSGVLRGYFDDETCRLEPIENPFGPKVFTYVLGMNCYPDSTHRRNDLH